MIILWWWLLLLYPLGKNALKFRPSSYLILLENSIGGFRHLLLRRLGRQLYRLYRLYPSWLLLVGFQNWWILGHLNCWLFFVAYSTDHEWPAAHVISSPDRCSSHLWRSEMSAASGKIWKGGLKALKASSEQEWIHLREYLELLISLPPKSPKFPHIPYLPGEGLQILSPAASDLTSVGTAGPQNVRMNACKDAGKDVR